MTGVLEERIEGPFLHQLARIHHGHPIADVGDHAEHPELCGRCVENVAADGEDRQFV